MKKLAALAMAALMVVLMAGCQVIRAEATEYKSLPEIIRETVFGDAGVSEDEVHDKEIDFDDGNYEVEFKKDGVEYEYEVNAETGKIVESEKERDDDFRRGENGKTSSGTAKERIGSAEAMNAALAAAGLSENEVYDKDVDFDDGVYEVEFKSGGVEYEFIIDPYTGEVLHSEKEQDDDFRRGENGKTSSGTAKERIGSAEAMNAALAAAGLSEREVYDKDVDFDDGVYEVEFKSGGVEYEFIIDPYTGEVLHSEKERDDDWYEDRNEKPSAEKERISGSDAMKIALEAAGLSEREVYDKDVDFDDGVYEVEFKSGGVEYEFIIDPYTGAVIHSHTEYDDDWFDDDDDDDDDYRDDWDDDDDDDWDDDWDD